MLRRLLLTAAVSLALACEGGPAPADVQAPAEKPQTSLPQVDMDLGDTLAEVGGVPVGSREFIQVAARRVPKDGADSLSPEERLELLDDLIDQKALYLEARRQGLDQDPKVQRQMIQILLRKTVYSQVKSMDFTEEELQAFYEAHRDEFVVPEKVRVRRIFVKAEPTRSTEEARKELEAALAQIGGDLDVMGDVARERSEGPYRGRGGDVGLITRQGRMGLPQEVVDKAFSMQEGQISEPFEADGGWNAVGLISRKDKVERTFEQIRGAVLRRAKAERHEKLYEETVQRLRGELDVQVYEDKVQALEVDPPRRIDALRNTLPPEARRLGPGKRGIQVPDPDRDMEMPDEDEDEGDAPDEDGEH